MTDDEISSDGAPQEAYELDLDQNSDADLAEVLEAAVAAVDRTDGDATEVPEAKSAESESHHDGDEDDVSAREQLLRTLADLDNYRKRSEREKDALRKYAIFDVVKAFLSVTDNLERALTASGTVEDLKQGVQMILRQQDELLRKQGVVPVESVGKVFDPTIHEAVLREDQDVEHPTVVNEFQKGYLLHDRLLRPAMVTVAMPTSASGRDEAAEQVEEQ